MSTGSFQGGRGFGAAYLRLVRSYLRHLCPLPPPHTGLLEGINNRMAYGFRDQEYFFLKIQAAFPGNPR